jgi:peptidoglycan/xylan/chitin deacetylase (PgdA/CDA1 family)
MNIKKSGVVLAATCAVILAIRAQDAEGNPGPIEVSVGTIAPDILNISWDAVIGRTYELECTTSLPVDDCCWKPVMSIEEVDEDIVNRTVFMEDPVGFYRVKLLPEPLTLAVPGNLVNNGGFEQASGSTPTSWLQGGYGSNVRTFTYPVAGHAGSARAARLKVSSYQSGDAKWYPQEIAVSPGSTYRFSDWYYSDAEANITMRFNQGGTYVYQWMTLPAASSAWRQIAFNFTVPSGASSMTVFHALTRNGTLTMDDVSITQSVLSEGLISFDIDDGWDPSTLTGAQILQSAGYRGTFYLVTSRIGRPTVINVDQARALYAAGHEIGAHTMGHTNLTNMTLTLAQREITQCKSILASWGIPTTAFAYPFGGYNATIQRYVKEAGFVGASGTDGGFNSRSSYDRYGFLRVSIGSHMSLSDVTSRIDAAIAEKKWLIILAHHIRSDMSNSQTITPAFYQSVVNYVKSKNAKVVTATQGYRLFL